MIIVCNMFQEELDNKILLGGRIIIFDIFHILVSNANVLSGIHFANYLF